MKYLLAVFAILIAIAFGATGFGLGGLLGAAIITALNIDSNILPYIFAVPFAIAFSVFGGCLFLVVVKTMDCVSSKFAEFIFGNPPEN